MNEGGESNANEIRFGSGMNINDHYQFESAPTYLPNNQDTYLRCVFNILSLSTGVFPNSFEVLIGITLYLHLILKKTIHNLNNGEGKLRAYRFRSFKI